jgi:exo-1,4-beta-D-glucosaminidase
LVTPQIVDSRLTAWRKRPINKTQVGSLGRLLNTTRRPRKPLSARTIGVLVVALLSVLPGCAGGGHVKASGPRAALGTSTLGTGGWEVRSSPLVHETGEQVSSPGFSTPGWLRVTPDDAGAPGTEITALVQHGACPHLFFSTNMRKCFGYQAAIGAVTTARFKVPWWFRTETRLPFTYCLDAKLVINGVVGQADVWMNGTEVATSAQVEGDYSRYVFDVTTLMRSGVNVVALEVEANNPLTMFTVDTVDWNQIPPDNNTGIQFPVQLHISRALGLDQPYVMEANAADLSTSALTVKVPITNTTRLLAHGVVTATITPPSGGGSAIEATSEVTLAPGASEDVAFDPRRFPQLVLDHPLLWWPYQMGAQPLYGLSVAVSRDGVVSDSAAETFGIRTITTHLTAPTALAPHGWRAFAVNGRPFLFRAAGWAENLLLRYSSADVARQVSLIKNIGLNGIRTEGQQMPPDFYEQMDRAGIMIDGGFQCCDAWQPANNGTDLTAHDYRVIELSALTIGQQLRNHPSVIDFSWSDVAPTPRQEQVSLRGFDQAGFQDPLISSAEYRSSPVLGPSGEREGPYDWVPPSFWSDNAHAPTVAAGNLTLGQLSGSGGFASEQSAGDTVPTLDSIERFLSASDQAELWHDPASNQYHANYEPGHAVNQFGTLFNLDTAIAQRYGRWTSLAGYVEEAQVQNYEDTRAQFEAYISHSADETNPATGIVYWQLNKGWPTLLWDLYNSDYDQAGSYFGAQEANRTVHVFYAYDSGTVGIDNLTGDFQGGLSVDAAVRTLGGAVLDHQVVSGLEVVPQGVHTALLTPRVGGVPAATSPATTYFLELTLRHDGAVIDRNVYWFSTQPDSVNWPAVQWWNSQIPIAQYADLRSLQGLAPSSVTATAHTLHQPGAAPAATVTTVTITNTSTTSTVTFFVRADLRRGQAGGMEASGDNEVLPVSWSDNDVTLWPGESQTLTVTYDSSLLRGSHPVVRISGWNLAGFDVAA